MKCKIILITVVTLMGMRDFSMSEQPKVEVKKNIQITAPEQVKVRGDLVKRMELAVSYLDQASRRDLWNGFKCNLAPGHSEGMWCADWPGRTLEAYARTSLSLGRPSSERYDEVRYGLLALQQPDGAFHNGEPIGGQLNGMVSDLHAKGNGFWFGNARGLLGYIWANRYEGEWSKFREPSKDLGDYFVEHYFDKDQVGAPSSFWWVATEALTQLYRNTGDSKYLDTAIGVGETIPPVNPNSQHTHSYLLSLRGIVDLCEESGGHQDLLDKVLQQYDFFREQVMWPGGGIIEHMGSLESYIPNYWFDEACSVCDWLGLNLDLWRMSLDAKYLDMAERVALNHLLYDQDAAGGFCGDRGIDFVREGSPWPFCCAMHGTRTLSEVTQYIAMTDAKDIYIGLFYPSTTQLTVSGQPVEVDIETAYPKDGKLRITLKPVQEAAFNLRIRVPAWSEVKSLQINGTSETSKVEEGFLVLNRTWKPNDQVALELAMPLRTEKRNQFVGNNDSTDYSRVSLWKGPLHLVYNQELNNHLWEMEKPRPALRYVYQVYEELQFDKSVQGTPLKIGSKSYSKGLGTHSVSEIVYALGGEFTEFMADIGIDESAGDSSAVRFKVCVDGVVKHGDVVKASMSKEGEGMIEAMYGFQVSALSGKEEARTIRVDIRNAQVLRLCVDDGVNGLEKDYADWADARLVRADGTSVYLSDLPDDRAKGLPWDWGVVQLKELEDRSATPEVVTLAYDLQGKILPIRFNHLADLGYSLIQHRPVLATWMRAQPKK